MALSLVCSAVLHLAVFLTLAGMPTPLDLPATRVVSFELLPRSAGEDTRQSESKRQAPDPLPASPAALEADSSPARETSPAQHPDATVERGSTVSPAGAERGADRRQAIEPVVVDATSLDPAASAAVPARPRDGREQLLASVRLDYLNWLRRHQSYPLSARRRGIEGVVRVRFEVDVHGELLANSLVESSGSRRLDVAAMNLVSRAAPFPPLPAELAVDRLELTLPIEYRLQGVETP